VPPLGTVHTYAYRYDANVPWMISIAVERERPELLDHQQPWLLERAVGL
jgi:hypothetical protein